MSHWDLYNNNKEGRGGGGGREGKGQERVYKRKVVLPQGISLNLEEKLTQRLFSTHSPICRGSTTFERKKGI